MKVRFLALAAAVLGLASCQQDVAPVVPASGEVDFQLTVDAVEIATRAGEHGEDDGQAGLNSAYGAIDYLQASTRGDEYRLDWNDVDLRYSLEVYDVADDYSNATPVKDRYVIIKDQYEPVTFDLRLIPNRDYRFVVFADFVPNGSTGVDASVVSQADLGKHHTIGATLQDIELKDDAINDESTDAYFYAGDIRITNSEAQSVVLKRPYGKVRVIATDLAELNLNIDPTKVVVKYYAQHPQTFNAVTGNIGVENSSVTATFESLYNEGVGKNSLANHFYTVDYDGRTATNMEDDTRHTHMTLFTDYILATAEQSPISFDMTVYEGDQVIKHTEFSTQIPVQRNHLTTIVGNVLTTATEINVTIDDNFNNSGREYYVFEAFVNGGEVTLDRDYVIGRPLFVEADAVLNLNGHTITNSVENAETDVIIVRDGGKLTINGEGRIEAVSGNDGYAVVVRDNGELTINGGIFAAGVDAAGEANAVIYARDNGKVYVNGGYFPNEAQSTFVLNKRDADRATTTIEVRGGTFEYFDPMNNAAENAGTNFVANGFASSLEGDHTYVVRAANDYVYHEDTNTIDVYTANGLLKWSWMVANGNNTLNVKLMASINLPMYTVEEDATNETYKYTTTPVTITDGKPSASNWVQVGTYSPYNVYYDALVDGNGYTISNLSIYSELSLVTGFIGWSENIEVRDLTFNNATIYSTGSYVSPLAYILDGSYIHNVHVKSSYIRGQGYVAGIAAEAMDHYDDPDKSYVLQFMSGERNKLMPLVTIENCTTDANTTIVGAGSTIGGIVGQAYGSLIVNCHNKADVSGAGYVGGIAGFMRDYFYGQYGYIVNCSSTDCKISSTGARVGGIVGHVMEGHDGSAWVVGCYSNSTINSSAKYVGSIVGYSSADNKILGNYAVSTRPVIGYADANNSTTSFSVATDADLTAEMRAKMNEGVAEYNAFAQGYSFPASPAWSMPDVDKLPLCVTW